MSDSTAPAMSDTKAPLHHPPSTSDGLYRRRKSMHIIAFAAVSCVMILTFTSMSFYQRRQHLNCTDDFVWKNIVPHRDLHWKQCYRKYQCTRLQVPRDYSEPDGDKAAIALYKIPSLLSPQDRRYRGPILINPGGPGNPPFSLLQSSGDRYQSLVGPEFDIVAFDPRGVGETTPTVYGFEDDAERVTWTLREPPLINATLDALSKRISRARVLNNLIKQKSGEAAEHVSSAMVARDMLSIVKAHGMSRLQYWGSSYGAILGITYAKLFPNNVGPMVIDGPTEVEDYYSTKWASNLDDANKVVQAFYNGCATVGPSLCAFHRKSAAEVKRRLDSLFESVRSHPIPGLESGGGVYGVVDYTVLQLAFLDAIYSPYTEFPDFAQALTELEAGNGTRMLARAQRTRLQCPKCEPVSPSGEFRVESRLATMCNDGKPVTDTEDELLAHYKSIAGVSNFADFWASYRVGCSGWNVRPKFTVTGPFSANTSFPLLFLGNTADPVSPIKYINETSMNYNPSVLLTQAAFGHCSSSAQSHCIDGWIRKYFRDGHLPPPGTVCDIDVKLFGDKSIS